MSSCYKSRRLISASKNSSCGVCFVQCVRRKESFDRRNRGWITTAIHPLTSPWTSEFPAENNIVVYWNNLPIKQDLAPYDISLFTNLTRGNKRTHSESVEDHHIGRKDGAEGHPRWIVPAIHRSVTDNDKKSTLDSRGEFWNYVVFSVGSEIYCFWHPTRYISDRPHLLKTIEKFFFLFSISYGFSISLFDMIQSLLSNWIMKVTLTKQVPRSFYLNAGVPLHRSVFWDTFCSSSSLTTFRILSVHETVSLLMTQVFIYRIDNIKLTAAVEHNLQFVVNYVKE